ncbi:MAG TPA: calcium-binding protein [Arsenophonus nasoniae]|uniref:calcium-binding protein n=1 Tax=Arsenophonus nasoniae TaxID=638 RepID=UPI0038795378
MMALKKGENKIVPMIAIKEPTSGHDIIELPVGYRLNENRLDAMAGNDIITDLSGRDNIINACSGDDMVTVIKGNNIIDAGPGDDIVATAKGNNIILPGEGNDIVNSGIGDDTIITTNGNDEINCGKGNNAIFINHQVGHITINCAGGSDTIYIQNFDHYFSDGNIRYYIADNQQDYFIKSKDKKSSITIKNAVANDDKVKIYRGINNGNYLDSDNINILIDKLSAFNKRKDRASLNLIEFINNGVEQNIFVASQYSY